MTWHDGSQAFFPLAHLRRQSPSAESRQIREELARNPLTVLPASSGQPGPLRALGAELVGNYAIRVHFSDGHSTGIYSWSYLREIAPSAPSNAAPAPNSPPPGPRAPAPGSAPDGGA